MECQASDVDSITVSWMEGSSSTCGHLRDGCHERVLGSKADAFANWRVEIKLKVSSTGLPETDWAETLGSRYGIIFHDID